MTTTALWTLLVFAPGSFAHHEFTNERTCLAFAYHFLIDYQEKLKLTSVYCVPPGQTI